ncbi:VOC family protein [Microcella sp.]|uniref:VOC family protein n=1 Tax=Microcella sp. TaxID=1913979 RepID=UPI00262B2628|nr:VOC family protein [Microcella sp.]
MGNSDHFSGGLVVTARQLRLVIRVDDYDAAVSFWRDALGLEETAAFEGEGDARVMILEVGRATIELANAAQVDLIDRIETDDHHSPPLRVAIEVDDSRTMSSELEKSGARVIASARETPWHSLNARLAAPDGIELTLFEELGGGPSVRRPAESSNG